MQWVIASLNALVTGHWFIDCINSLIHRLTKSPIHWSIDSSRQCFNTSLSHRFTAFTHSLFHRFIGSFGQLCMDSFKSFHWHLNHHFLICWCASQLQQFIECFYIPKRFYWPSSSCSTVVVLSLNVSKWPIGVLHSCRALARSKATQLRRSFPGCLSPSGVEESNESGSPNE